MPEIHLAFETVAKIRDISPGEMMYVEVGDEPVCLINIDGEHHALNDAIGWFWLPARTLRY
jgi:nitrite reductase/ring-hydroxylating ferredoxin subunit